MQVFNAMEQLDKVLIVLLIYSVFKTDKKDFAKVFLNEWKYIFTEKNAKQYIYGDLEILSDESNKNILMKKIIMKDRLKLTLLRDQWCQFSFQRL